MRNNRIFVCQANRPLLLESCDKNLKIIFVEKRFPHPFPAQKVNIVRGLENVKLMNSDKRIIDGLEI